MNSATARFARLATAIGLVAGGMLTVAAPASASTYPDPGAVWLGNENSIVNYSGAGATTALTKITGPHTGLSGLSQTGMAVDENGTVFVALCGVCGTGADAIESFNRTADGDATPDTDLSGANTGLDSPTGLVISPDQIHLWVSNYANATVSEFALTDTGNVMPVATISGAKTGIVDPVSLAVSPDGKTLYVGVHQTNTTGGIVAFPTTAHGNVAPTSRISGPLTALKLPTGLAFGTDGYLRVIDGQDAAELTFAPGAHGDVAPYSTFEQAGLALQSNVAMDTAGNLWTGFGYTATRIGGASTKRPSVNGTIDTTATNVQANVVGIWDLPPATAGIPSATAGNRSAHLSWTAGLSAGNETGYLVLKSAHVTGPFAVIGSSTKPSYTATGLTAGKAVYFTIRAINAVGYAGDSTIAAAKPYGPPSAPRSLKTKPKATSIALTWKAPSSTGGKTVTGYVVSYATCKLGPKSCHAKHLAAKSTHSKVKGLKPHKTYYVDVAAKNSAGTGAATAVKKAKTT